MKLGEHPQTPGRKNPAPLFRHSDLEVDTKSEKGFAFIEILVAIALLGMIAATYLGAVGTNYKASTTATEEAVAQKIAAYMTSSVTDATFEQSTTPSYADGTISSCSNSTMQIYDVKNNPVNVSGYSTQISAATVNDGSLLGNESIQKTTVKVMHGTKVVASIQNYKWINDPPPP